MHRPTSTLPPFLVFVALTLAGAACSTLPIAPPTPVTDPSSLRSTTSGAVVGFVGAYDSHVWLGIPFARPPLGELRWRAPEPPQSWEGTREALAFGPHCPQLASPLGGVMELPEGTFTGQEDCLYLNVYAPHFEPQAVPRGDERLPVMVWIHGGGNVVGRANFFDGGHLAADQDVVVVTVNYRLGPLGWLRHESLRGQDRSDLDRSGNFGTLDHIRALAWVRDHIDAFGGDPGNVTIFGESAGGRNVMALLLAPAARGLFHRAIAQSGAVPNTAPAEAENFVDAPVPGHRNSSNEMLLRLLVDAGEAPDRETARAKLGGLDAAAIEHFWYARTPEALVGAVQFEGRDGRWPQVYMEGTVLPEGDGLAHLARADGHARVPILLGTNRDENKLFLFGRRDLVRQWFGVVPRVRNAALYLATADALSALWKATGADGPAAALRTNQEAVFVYRFDWDEEPSRLGFDVSRYIGASHGFEIPFVFGHWDLGPAASYLFTDENEEGRLALSAQMRGYWAEFARRGAPGRGGADFPAWTAWDPAPDGHKFMILDTAADGGARLGSEPITEASVVAQVERDGRLRSQADRCFVLREMVHFGRNFTESDYREAGREGCAAFPLADYP